MTTSILGDAKVVSQVAHPVVEITPELAAKWLEQNQNNRKLRQYKVEAYADAMKNGQWRGTREPIEFSEDGELINGQHRLTAIVVSGITVHNPVREGVKRDEIPIMDTGLSRQASDVLSMDGHKNSTQLSAAAKLIYMWRNAPSMTMNRAGSKRVNNELIKRFVEQHSGLTESVEIAKRYGSTFRLVPPSAVAAVHYEIADAHGVDKATEFVEKMTLGHDLHPGCPILALRNVLSKSQTSLTRPPIELRMAWMVHSFNKWSRGESNVKLIKHRKDQDFPKVHQMFK